MPELPEVETLKTDFNARVKGETITTVIFDPQYGNSLKQHANRDLEAILPGKKIVSATRVGKYLVLDLNNNFHLTFHLKIYGRLLIDQTEVPFGDPERLTIKLRGGKIIKLIDRSNIASVFILNDQELDDLEKKHGPDPFTDLASEFSQTLKEHASLMVKEAILKPKVVAGVGNIYADEALFLSKISPVRKAGGLNPNEVETLFTNIRKVLEQGIKFRGTTIDSWYDTAGIPGENQNYLNVYGKEGQPCPVCSNPIKLTEVAGRRTYYCPVDQPEEQLSLF